MNDHTMPIITLKHTEKSSRFTYCLFHSVVCRESEAFELWSVTATEQSGSAFLSCLLCDVAENAEEAERLVRFLCENAVSPFHAAEVCENLPFTAK